MDSAAAVEATAAGVGRDAGDDVPEVDERVADDVMPVVT